MKQRALETFDQNDVKWARFAWNAALQANLQLGRYEAVLSYAENMQRHGKEMNAFTYKMVILAHLRRGDADKADRLLRSNAAQMGFDAVECYREMIDYYMKTRGDIEQACVRCLEMIDKGIAIEFSDWCTALELALQLSDTSVYWYFRKQMRVRAPVLDSYLPQRLLVLEKDQTHASGTSSLRKKGKPVTSQPQTPEPAITTTNTRSNPAALKPEATYKSVFDWVKQKLWPTDSVGK